jgi:hypothetical protein
MGLSEQMSGLDGWWVGGTDPQMLKVAGRYVSGWVDGLRTDLWSLNEFDKNESRIMVQCSYIITGGQKVLCCYRKFFVDARIFKQWNLS